MFSILSKLINCRFRFVHMPFNFREEKNLRYFIAFWASFWHLKISDLLFLFVVKNRINLCVKIERLTNIMQIFTCIARKFSENQIILELSKLCVICASVNIWNYIFPVNFLFVSWMPFCLYLFYSSASTTCANVFKVF